MDEQTLLNVVHVGSIID